MAQILISMPQGAQRDRLEQAIETDLCPRPFLVVGSPKVALEQLWRGVPLDIAVVDLDSEGADRLVAAIHESQPQAPILGLSKSGKANPNCTENVMYYGDGSSLYREVYSLLSGEP